MRHWDYWGKWETDERSRGAVRGGENWCRQGGFCDEGREDEGRKHLVESGGMMGCGSGQQNHVLLGGVPSELVS